MSSRRPFTAMLFTLILLACDQDAPSGPVQEPSLGVVGQQNSGFPVAFALGHAELSLFSISDKYSFAAVRDPKGVFRGAFEWKSVRPDGSTASGRGRVICARIVGHVAHISGVFEQDDVPWIEPPLNYAMWSVEDNSNGQGTPPDRVSLLHPSVTQAQAEAHCVADSFLAMLPNERGEIIVRDGTVLTRNGHDDR